MSKLFQPSRADGRSDRQVVYDLVVSGEPESFYSYDTLLDALEEGLEERPDRARAQRAVAAANKVLLRERRRYLSVVRNRGYRMIGAEEHLPVALGQKGRAETYLRKGLDLLKHARLDELSEAQRTLHEGQLMVMAGVYQAVKASERRHDRQEELIAEVRRQQDEIRERLNRLEGGD